MEDRTRASKGSRPCPQGRQAPRVCPCRCRGRSRGGGPAAPRASRLTVTRTARKRGTPGQSPRAALRREVGSGDTGPGLSFLSGRTGNSSASWGPSDVESHCVEVFRTALLVTGQLGQYLSAGNEKYSQVTSASVARLSPGPQDPVQVRGLRCPRPRSAGPGPPGSACPAVPALQRCRHGPRRRPPRSPVRTRCQDLAGGGPRAGPRATYASFRSSRAPADFSLASRAPGRLSLLALQRMCTEVSPAFVRTGRWSLLIRDKALLSSFGLSTPSKR